MFDFKLTQRGDISLVNNETISSFKLSFSLSKYKGQRISFLMPQFDKIPKSYPQSVSFYIQEKPERIMSELNLKDSKEKMQAARIELKTERKNIYNYDAGSTFFSLNHTIYKKEESLVPIREKIQEIMSKYFPNCTVKVNFKTVPEGYFWCQTLFAAVYDSEDKLIDSFEV